MAGAFGATISNVSAGVFLYNIDRRTRLCARVLQNKILRSAFAVSRMANIGVESCSSLSASLPPQQFVQGPSPKMQKLYHYVANQPAQSLVPFFRVKKLSDKAVLPSRGSPLSAGYDLSSAADTKVPARGKALIPTDLSIAIPEGTYARIAPRSGLTWKHSINVGAGVVDADYRGPLGVVLFNHSDADCEIKVGDRIAQLIIVKIETPDVTEVEELDATERGEGGFGSTGV